ncbi:YbgC/FadM family acyl-CoA thioesterase [Sphingobium sufflavum]|uniref:YbgC/FadM family acyl-CoA thioesterase n=1 Tax=Sphingobium sufflavum TaxID=1129547 RepID=UPI001F3141EA|nr:YbgC/FadM family acyl-CoA thioesterase [Sphingobium sufflavum]MCE7796627.1 YbgC/FadM family acyl-CoA thioesterase [Sphingobium sufflavum]
MAGETLPLPANGHFRGGSHHFPVRVYFEDTDLSAVVYHANYLRFMERARSDMLRQAGVDQRGTHASGGGYYAIADLSLRYLRPASLDDDLVILSRMRTIRAASVVIDQSIWRGTDQLTDGSVTAAFLSATGRPQRQPASWISAYHRLASGEDPRP